MCDFAACPYHIDIMNKDFDRPEKIQIALDYLIHQGNTLTNDHVILHQIIVCDCIEYNIKIKIVNKLIKTLRRILKGLEEKRKEELRISMSSLELSNNNSNNNNSH